MKRFLLFLLIFLSSSTQLLAVNYAKGQLLVQTNTALVEPLPSFTLKAASANTTKEDPILNKYLLRQIKRVPNLTNPQTINQAGTFLPTKSQEKKYIYKLIFEDRDINILDLIEEFKKDPSIIHAQPNYRYQTFYVPNDVHYSKQWNLPLIKAEDAWDIISGEEDIIVAVIDSGVDWEHEDLRNNIWQNPYETENGQDSDNNGYVDDIHGWDFAGTVQNNILYPDNNPTPEDGHGTHIAGIIAAQTNNSLGIAGIAPQCSIMPLRCGNNDTGLYTDAVLAAIDYAVANGAKVINMSFGAAGVQDLLFEQSINTILQSNILVVAAAGNDTLNLDAISVVPASYEGVMAVSAITPSKDIASYSNFGQVIDITAPGGASIGGEPEKDIPSTYPNQQYSYASGTSMAAPHISAVAALLFSYYPAATTRDVYLAITTSAEDLGIVGRDVYYGYGLVDVPQALSTLQTNLAAVDTQPPNTFELYGANGPTSPILNSPNPFDPTTETTSICFQTNEFARITISIYSLNLKRVKYASLYSAGYHEEIWDGRDQNGSFVPNGVYVLVVKAEANGKTTIKRSKIAVLRK